MRLRARLRAQGGPTSPGVTAIKRGRGTRKCGLTDVEEIRIHSPCDPPQRARFESLSRPKFGLFIGLAVCVSGAGCNGIMNISGPDSEPRVPRDEFQSAGVQSAGAQSAGAQAPAFPPPEISPVALRGSSPSRFPRRLLQLRCPARFRRLPQPPRLSRRPARGTSRRTHSPRDPLQRVFCESRVTPGLPGLPPKAGQIARESWEP